MVSGERRRGSAGSAGPESAGAIDLSAASWPRVPADAVVLVPIGSTEQHGPHLPFDTDTVIALAVAAGVAERLGRGAVVAPALAFGASGEHQSFAGTVSIGHEALRFVLLELVRSLSTWAGRVVLVNGHGGNVTTLASAVPQLVAEGHRVAWVPCTVPRNSGFEGVVDAHAGRVETSLMLHLVPHAVALPLPPAGSTTPLPELFARLAESGVESVSPSGILGDPTGATAAEGEALLVGMIANATARVAAGGPDANGMLGVSVSRASGDCVEPSGEAAP